VRLAKRHESGDGHVDVQFVLDLNEASPISLWDCVTGFGSTSEEQAATAARIWAQTTAAALLELKYSGLGRFADHYHAGEPSGFPGWHAIAGPVMGYGRGESAGRLQKWWLENPLLSLLAPAMASAIPETGPCGLKLFFGGDSTAEVRLDGDYHAAGSSALLALTWPRLQPAGFVRSYVVLAHPE
jgi:Family of unknown function (DUF6348)